MEEARQQDDERGYLDKLKSKAKIVAYGTIAKTDLGNRNKDELLNWMQKQCYLAISQLMVTCADMKIDSCPFEGYRAKNDRHQYRNKVRKPNNLLFEDK